MPESLPALVIITKTTEAVRLYESEYDSGKRKFAYHAFCEKRVQQDEIQFASMVREILDANRTPQG